MANQNYLAQVSQQKFELEQRKKGKTPEQARVIDFFLKVDLGGCGCLSKTSTTLTMEEYMRLVATKCNSLNINAMAMAKINLDESEIQEITPIMLSSFLFDDDCLVKVQNGVAVSSQYAITKIFFSATQIFTYQYIFDTTSDNTWETTRDFFYTDITCLKTSHENKEKIDIFYQKGCFVPQEKVVKSNYTVDRFEIIVPGASYSFSMRNGDELQRSLQAAKAMFRDKKFEK